MDNRPIGIFDSGSGGLSIWKSITTLLPHESTVYIGDHVHIPYSTKSSEDIVKRVQTLIGYLLTQNVKLIVIACNTATVAGIDIYRNTFPHIPIIGVVPVIKTAAEVSKTKSFLILSTEHTAKSIYQKELIRRYAKDCKVQAIGNTELVKAIEEGKRDSKEVKDILEQMLLPIKGKNFDAVVLGCTHFPFVRHVIQSIVGSSVRILDSGEAVGRQVLHILGSEHLESDVSLATYQFFTTGDVQLVQEVARDLLNRPIVVNSAPDSVQ